MRALSIEDIKENPWNVMLNPLPKHPTRHLLLIAQIAATCYREVAGERWDELKATYGDAEFAPPEFDVALEDWWRGHRKIGEIIHLLEDRFGIPNIDFNLSRNVRTFSVVVWLKGLMWRYWKV